VAVGAKRKVAELPEFVDAAIMGNADEMDLAIRVMERS
jgi:hypothetical protein